MCDVRVARKKKWGTQDASRSIRWAGRAAGIQIHSGGGRLEVGAAAGEIHAKTDLRMRQVCLPALLEVPNPGEWMNRNTACSVAAACILGVALGDPSRPRLENQPLEFSMLF